MPDGQPSHAARQAKTRVGRGSHDDDNEDARAQPFGEQPRAHANARGHRRSDGGVDFGNLVVDGSDTERTDEGADELRDD